MSRYLLTVTAAVALLARAVSAEDPANATLPKLIPEPWERPATTTEQYQDLVKEHQSAKARYDRAVRRARTDAENQKLTVAYSKKLESLAMQFLELARDNPGESTSIDGLMWVAMHAPEAARSKSMADILNGHRHSGRFALIQQYLAQAESPVAATDSNTIAAGK